MSDDTAPPAELRSAAEELRLLAQARAENGPNEEQLRRNALDACFKRLDFKYRLAALIGENAADAVLASEERADVVIDVFSRLVTLRERMRSDLTRFLSQIEETGCQLQDAAEAASDEARAIQALVAEAHDMARDDLLRAAQDIAHLESELASSLGEDSSTLRKVRTIVDSYEYDGLVVSDDARRSDNARRRLREAVSHAFTATLPVVKAVYGQPNLRSLNEADYKAAVIRRIVQLEYELDPSNISETALKLGNLLLTTSATSIDIVRRRYAPGAPRRTTEDEVNHLVKYLRNRQLAAWLQPRDASDGHGSGEVVACRHLLYFSTGAKSVSEIAKFVRAEQPPRRRSKKGKSDSDKRKSRRTSARNHRQFRS